MTAKKIKLNDMSYKVIEKNEYGVLVIDDEILNGISDVCRKCKYLSNCEDEWMKCIINTYNLPDSEAEKLESENPLMNTTIDDLYIESKCYFEVKKKLDDTQKELIDLRVELRVEKEKSKALEAYSRGLELRNSEYENKTICYETVVTTIDCKNHNVFVPENLDATQQLDYYDKIFGQWLSWAKK